MNSRVTNWIARQVDLLHNPPEEEYGAPKKLTVRVDPSEYDRLGQVAQYLGVSKTHCAEELLKAAIVDAAEGLFHLDSEFGSAPTHDLGFEDFEDASHLHPSRRNGGAGVESQEVA